MGRRRGARSFLNQNRGSNRRQINQYRNLGKQNNNVTTIVQNYQPIHTVLPGLGMPDELDVTLCYYDDLNIASGLSSNQMTYEGNNPWDPDPQLGGRSADEYVALSRLYRYCRVYGSAIEVNYAIINSDSFQCVVTPKAEKYSMSYEMLMCMPRSKSGRIVSPSGTTSWTIRNDCNTASLYGIPNLDWDINNQFSLFNPDLSTSVTEPVRKWYWHVAFSTVATQNSLNGAAKVRIYYRCHFYGRKYDANLTSVSNDGDEDIDPLLPSGTTLISDPPSPLITITNDVPPSLIDTNTLTDQEFSLVKSLVKKFSG